MTEPADVSKQLDPPPAKTRDPFRFRLIGDINVAGVSVALVGITVAIVLGLMRINSAQKALGVQIQSVERKVEAQGFTLTSPVEGSSVNLTDIVRGKTPFPAQNTYLVITPLETGDDYVQDGPIKINSGGLWTAHGRFGTGEVGVGQKFLVRALSTRSVLPAGKLTDVPEDAIFSDAVTVVRR
ncbi:MAG TPA: hypothetical protein VGJ30_12150 [Candidatus Angelobacter sp.]|jgi:hypothetical protein